MNSFVSFFYFLSVVYGASSNSPLMQKVIDLSLQRKNVTNCYETTELIENFMSSVPTRQKLRNDKDDFEAYRREIEALMDQLREPKPKLVAFDIEPNDIKDSTGHSFAIEIHRVGDKTHARVLQSWHGYFCLFNWLNGNTDGIFQENPSHRKAFHEASSRFGKPMDQDEYFYWLDLLAANLLLRSSTEIGEKYKEILEMEAIKVGEMFKIDTVGVPDIVILMIAMNGFATQKDENPEINVRIYDMSEEKSDS